MANRVLLPAIAVALLGVGGVVYLRTKAGPSTVNGRTTKLSALAPEELDAKAAQDALLFKRLVGQINRLEQRIATSTLWDRPPEQGLSADERREALELFQSVIDHAIALDRIERFHLDFWTVNVVAEPERHARHFALFFGSYVEKLALALTLIDRTINKPQFEKLFDEGNAALGIAPGAYAKLKWNVVHVEDASAALAAHQYKKVLQAQLDALERQDANYQFVDARLEDRYDTVKENLTKKSVKLFGGNTTDIGKDAAHAVWFPVQAEAAEVMGDTRVHREDQPLISVAQALEAAKQSEPGDVLVERRNWYLSNIGLPGFWPHAALYLGTPDELTKYFDDADVTKAYGMPFPAFLQKQFPDVWSRYLELEPASWGPPGARDVAHPHRVIEAMSEGVIFTSAEHSIGTADYVAAMRPRRSKLDKARAIERAFSYESRPYDFDFDFFTDTSLVCSELVFKAYEPRKDTVGLDLPLEKVVGRMTLGPNTIVRLFDEAFGGARQQLDFAWFLDASEQRRAAQFSTVEAFRASHQRPKWDVVQR